MPGIISPHWNCRIGRLPDQAGNRFQDSAVKSAFLPIALMVATPAHASPADLQCVGNGKRFEIGQYACLLTGEQDRLARCETNLNTPTWTTRLDHCPGGKPQETADSFSCRANYREVPAGGFACLTISGQKHLARCDEVLNTPSWTTVQDGCPGGPLPKLATKPEKEHWLRNTLDVPKRLFNTLLDRL